MPPADGSLSRDRMVTEQIAARGVGDLRVLEAMRHVPREDFVPERPTRDALADQPLPIGHGQTISQPYIVALMAEAAQLSPHDHVLEIGTGSGYGAAVLRECAGSVVTVERKSALAEDAGHRLKELGYDDITVITGDGTDGWSAAAPYDAIVVTAAGPSLPVPLAEQLAEGGRLVMPIGRRKGDQVLVRFTRRGQELRREELGGVRFVPLVGSHGFRR